MKRLALTAGTLGAVGALLMKSKQPRASKAGSGQARSVWARPGMNVTFRAEVMPGRDRSERTFRVAELLPSGRVSLQGAVGEHAEKEFEPIR